MGAGCIYWLDLFERLGWLWRAGTLASIIAIVVGIGLRYDSDWSKETQELGRRGILIALFAGAFSTVMLVVWPSKEVVTRSMVCRGDAGIAKNGDGQ